MRLSKVVGLCVLFGLACAIRADDLVILNNNLFLSNVYAGTTVTNYFFISNASGKPLTLGSARPTCGCTFAEVSTNSLPAGGRASVKFGYKPSNQPGHLTKRILLDVAPADPSAALSGPSVYQLVFSAKVLDIFACSIEQAVLSAKNNVGLKNARAECLISSLVGCEKMELASLTANNDSVKVRRYGKSGSKIRILVTVDPGRIDQPGVIGMFSAVVSCGGESKTFNIPVFVELTGPLKSKK